MKRLIATLALILPLAYLWADTSTTGSLQLLKPSIGVVDRTRSSGDKLNSNFDIIDSSFTNIETDFTNLEIAVYESTTAFESTYQGQINFLSGSQSTQDVLATTFQNFRSTSDTHQDATLNFLSTAGVMNQFQNVAIGTAGIALSNIQTAFSTNSLHASNTNYINTGLDTQTKNGSLILSGVSSITVNTAVISTITQLSKIRFEDGTVQNTAGGTVDAVFSGNVNLYLHEKENITKYYPEGTGYKFMATTPSALSEVDNSITVTASDGMIIRSSWSCLPNVFGNISEIPIGYWALNYFVKVNNTHGVTKGVFEFWQADKDYTNKVLLFSTTGQEWNNTSFQEYTETRLVTSPISRSTDSIYIYLGYVKTTSPQNITVTFSHQGSSQASHIETSIGKNSTLLGLGDFPSTYLGQKGKMVYVNGSENAVLFGPTTGSIDAFKNFNSTASVQTLALNNFLSTHSTHQDATLNFLSTAGASMVSVNNFLSTHSTHQDDTLNFLSTAGVNIQSLNNFLSTHSTHQDTTLNFLSTTGVQVRNLNLFTSTSDAQQTKFVNFRSTTDVAIDGAGGASLRTYTAYLAPAGGTEGTADIFDSYGTTNAINYVNALGLLGGGSTVQASIHVAEGVYRVKNATIPVGVDFGGTQGSSTVFVLDSTNETMFTVYGRLHDVVIDCSNISYKGYNIVLKQGGQLENITYNNCGSRATGWGGFLYITSDWVTGGVSPSSLTAKITNLKIPEYYSRPALTASGDNPSLRVVYAQRVEINDSFFGTITAPNGTVEETATIWRSSHIHFNNCVWDDVAGRGIIVLGQTYDIGWDKCTFHMRRAAYGGASSGISIFTENNPANVSNSISSMTYVTNSTFINHYGALRPYIFTSASYTSESAYLHNNLAVSLVDSSANTFMDIGGAGLRTLITGNRSYGVGTFISDGGSGTKYTSLMNFKDAVEQ